MTFSLAGFGMYKMYKQACNDAADNMPWLGELPATMSNYLSKTNVKVVHLIDAFLGISLVVLGALALAGVLPVPPSMVETFGYSAIAVGGLNVIIASILAYQRL